MVEWKRSAIRPFCTWLQLIDVLSEAMSRRGWSHRMRGSTSVRGEVEFVLKPYNICLAFRNIEGLVLESCSLNTASFSVLYIITAISDWSQVFWTKLREAQVGALVERTLGLGTGKEVRIWPWSRGFQMTRTTNTKTGYTGELDTCARMNGSRFLYGNVHSTRCINEKVRCHRKLIWCIYSLQ